MSVPQGERFSQNYMSKGEPTEDSERMRLRVLRLFTVSKAHQCLSADEMELETGSDVPRRISGHPDWEQYFRSCDLIDFLDAITAVARILRGRNSYTFGNWLSGIHTIFTEENVRYRVDDLGGVHFAIDGAFARNQVCAIAALQPTRYGAARAHFEAGQLALDGTPPQTRDAIRQTFECVETIFKLMFSDVSQLGASEVIKKLKPHIAGHLHGTEKDVANRLLEGFKEWVNSAHPFRHAQAVEEPDMPSIATAVLSVSLGTTYARWLAELDTAANFSS